MLGKQKHTMIDGSRTADRIQKKVAFAHLFVCRQSECKEKQKNKNKKGLINSFGFFFSCWSNGAMEMRAYQIA